jgi:hypothetical protein
MVAAALTYTLLSFVAGKLMLPLDVFSPARPGENGPNRGHHGRLRPQRPYGGAPNSTSSEAGAAASVPRAAAVSVMVDRWLPWIASAAVLGVFLPPLVSAPSVQMSLAAVPRTPVSVSELVEPPPMTELAGGKAHRRIYRRICCVDPVVDKAGN